MANYGITYDKVAAAANQLTTKNQAPTPDNIRKLIGAGSKTTISRHLKRWRSLQTANTPTQNTSTAATQTASQSKQTSSLAAPAETTNNKTQRTATQQKVKNQGKSPLPATDPLSVADIDTTATHEWLLKTELASSSGQQLVQMIESDLFDSNSDSLASTHSAQSVHNKPHPPKALIELVQHFWEEFCTSDAAAQTVARLQTNTNDGNQAALLADWAIAKDSTKDNTQQDVQSNISPQQATDINSHADNNLQQQLIEASERVELYQGYLQALEDELAELSGENYALKKQLDAQSSQPSASVNKAENKQMNEIKEHKKSLSKTFTNMLDELQHLQSMLSV